MELTITAKPRTVFGKQNSKLRKAGLLPAVLYGSASAKASADKRGPVSIPLQVSAKEFEKVYRKAGENTLINLIVGNGGRKKVLIHDVARHFMKEEPVHVDFYEVDLTRKIHAKIPLHFAGVSGAVKELGGVLVKNLAEVEVEALPTDLPQFIEIDISGLKNFEAMVRVGEIKVAPAVRMLTKSEEVVVSVQAPRTEEELAELEKPTAEAEKAAVEAVAAEAPEKKEGAEGEEKVAVVAEAEKPAEEKKEKKEEK